MKIPKSVKVGAYTYKVKLTSKLDSDGLCEDKTLTIWLKKDLHKTDLAITFMHECLHAIEHSYEIFLGEKKIKKLDTYLVSLLRDNNLTFLEK